MELIHLVGKVGAGKTKFHNMYFPGASVFEIENIYEIYGIIPVKLQDPETYRQFSKVVSMHLDRFCYDNHQQPIAFVRSSGIDRAINQALESHSYTTLLIHSHYSETEANTTKHPKAPILNQQIQNALDIGTLHWKYRFDGDTDCFYFDNQANSQGEFDARIWRENLLQA